MENAKNIFSQVLAVLAIFGAFSAAMFNWGRKVITAYCDVNAHPFFGYDLYGNLYCDLIIGFSHALFYTVATLIIIFVLGILQSILIRIWEIIKNQWEKFTDWSRIPSPACIHLYSGSVYDNVFTLRFKCTEWRYLFHRIKVSISTPVLYARSDLSQTKEYFSWRNVNEARMKTDEIYEVDLIEFDEDEKIFWFKADNIEEEKYKFPGKLGRQINVEVTFIRPIDNKELVTVRRFFFVDTTLRSKKDISAEIKNEVPIWQIMLQK